MVGTDVRNIDERGAVLKDADAVIAEAAQDGAAGSGAEVGGADAGLAVEGLAEGGFELDEEFVPRDDAGGLDLFEERLAGAVCGDDEFVESADGRGLWVLCQEGGAEGNQAKQEIDSVHAGERYGAWLIRSKANCKKLAVAVFLRL